MGTLVDTSVFIAIERGQLSLEDILARTNVDVAAEIQGRTLTDFVVAAAHEAACRAIAETDLVRVSLADQQHIADAILNPPAPSPALQKAYQRRRKLFEP